MTAKTDWEQSQLSLMLKAIHAQESKEAARKKASEVVEKLKEMKLNAAAKKLEDGIEETLTYMNFLSQHWLKIRTNNVIERLNHEIRRRTRAVGAFADGNSALMLVCARLRYVAGKDWGQEVLCIKYLEEGDKASTQQNSLIKRGSTAVCKSVLSACQGDANKANLTGSFHFTY